MHEMAVWLFDDCIGTLYLENGWLRFQYASDWLNHPNAVALSQSLPLQAEAFNDSQAKPFFAGLLPEGRMRHLIAQHLQISNQNDFAMLDHIGGECAGAVTLLPLNQQLSRQNQNIEWLDEHELVQILVELPTRPMLAGKDGLRLSLAGAQDKLPVVFDGKRIGLPRNGMPSSHILKPAISSVTDSVSNEGFCMALANVMLLQPAKTQIYHVLGHSFLLVERYDRTLDANHKLERLHQEDFCQALAVMPELKYQNEGGPSLTQCFDLLRVATRPNAPQVLRMLDYVLFNTLIGNHDAHAKNFSLLYTSRAQPQAMILAPMYDVLCTAIYENLTPKMAMKIGSKYKFNEIYLRHWMQFAKNVGLSPAQTKKRILQFAKQMPISAKALQATSTNHFNNNVTVEKIIQLIEQRCAQTILRMSETE